MIGIEQMDLSVSHIVVPPAFTPFELVVFGGSAGGIEPLREVISGLPAKFPTPIVVVHHLGAELRSYLPEVLNVRFALPCRWAREGDKPQVGEVLIAPPGASMRLGREGRLWRLPGTKPRMGWPSVDVFLHSVAEHLGPRVIAIVLSGMLRDGADGIAKVRRAGGATLVQHPLMAECPDMPRAAVDLGRADLMMSPQQIASALLILAEAGVM